MREEPQPLRRAARLRRVAPWLWPALVALLLVLALVLLTASSVPVHRQTRGVLIGLIAGSATLSLMLRYFPEQLETYSGRWPWRALLALAIPSVIYIAGLDHWAALVHQSAGAVRVLLLALPLVLIVWICVAFAWHMRFLDELQQRLELQSVAIGAAAGLSASAAGAALALSGAVQLSPQAVLWLLPTCLIGYSFARIVLTRRHA